MAYNDDLLNAAQNRRRTGRSFFPAANYPQGQTLIGSRYGTSSAVLPPDQNPAYQAAITRPRLQRGDLTTIQTPSGGFITVPSGSAGAAAQAVPGSQVTQIGNQTPIDRNAAFARGYGAPTPYIQGGYQVAGGIANPVENLSPQQRIAGGVGGTLDYFRSNPALQASVNALSGFGNSVAKFFNPSQSQPNTQSQNFYSYNPSPVPDQPRRYSDFY